MAAITVHTVREQLQGIIDFNQDKPSLLRIVEKVRQFVETGQNRNGTELAFFQYIDEGAKGGFSRALAGGNIAVRMAHREYQESLKQFLDNIKSAHATGERYNVTEHFNRVVLIVTGETGLIWASNHGELNLLESNSEACRLL